MSIRHPSIKHDATWCLRVKKPFKLSIFGSPTVTLHGDPSRTKKFSLTTLTSRSTVTFFRMPTIAKFSLATAVMCTLILLCFIPVLFTNSIERKFGTSLKPRNALVIDPYNLTQIVFKARAFHEPYFLIQHYLLSTDRYWITYHTSPFQLPKRLPIIAGKIVIHSTSFPSLEVTYILERVRQS